MKLSDAILMGDTLKRCNPTKWLSKDGSCGCAFGGALLAVGVTADQFFNASRADAIHTIYGDLPVAKSLWPWLTSEHVETVSRMYTYVSPDSPFVRMTIEYIVAYVRSIEPPESEPQPDGDPGDENDAKPPSVPFQPAEPAPVAA